MKGVCRTLVVIACLLFVSAKSTLAQKVEFSADMKVTDGTGQTQTFKLFVGPKRARFDRQGQQNGYGIGSILIDFQNQYIFMVLPQYKMYLQIEGSLGTPFYRGAWMFRPDTPQSPCHGWIAEANVRGVTLRCEPGGDDTIDSRPTQKWDASTPDRGQGSLWYDPALNFIVKALRISKTGVRSGYELQNAKMDPQPPDTFEVPKDYRKFTLQRLVDVFTGLGQW